MSASRSQIFDIHNAYHQPDFKRSSGLDASAQIVAHRLGRADKGIHHSKYWWRVIDKMTKRRYGAEGENLADGFRHSDELMNAWIHSPEHRKNITNPHFTAIGIGIAIGRNSAKPYYVVHFGGK